MSDPASEALSATDPRPRGLGNEALALVGSALVSALLCASVVLAPLCLFPVQGVYGRRGRRAGHLAALAAVVASGLALVARLASAGAFSLSGAASSFVSPCILLGALALVNAGFWSKVEGTYRVLAVAAACSAAGLPFLFWIVRDGRFVAQFESMLGEAIKPLLGQVAGDGSYDYAALAASLDPKAMAATVMRVVTYAYGPMIALVLGASAWFGNRASGPGSPGREASPPLSGYRAPYPLLWAFLCAWALVLAASMYAAAPEVLRAAAWNLALALSLPYAAQGLGIAASLFNRWNVPRFLRFAFAATALLALATPTASIVIAVGLPLLGVTEVWIPYRNPKGVGA